MTTRRFALRLIIITAPVLLLIWAGITAFLHENQRAALDGAERDTLNFSRAFEENITRTIDSIDTTIRSVRAARARDPEHFNITDWERDSGLSRDITLQLALTDRAGIVTASNLGPITSRIDLSDRPHFKSTRDAPGDTLLIGLPVIGRVSGKWSVQFVRKLFDANGAFDGMLVASLDPEFLSRFSKSLNIGRGMMLLAGADGVVRAAAPLTLMPIGSGLDSYGLLEPFRKAPLGTLVTEAGADHVERLVSWRRMDGLGLVVAVGLSREDVLAEFHRYRLNGLAIGGVLSLITILSGFAMIRSRSEMMRSQAILEAAVQNISQGLLVVDQQRHVPVMNARAIELLGFPPHLARPGVLFDDILQWQLSSGEFDSDEADEIRRLARSGGFSVGSSLYYRTRPNGTVLEFQSKQLESGLAVRTITDITAQRLYEANLAHARDAAMAAARARSAFLATMSHEIRTPLNGVIGIANLLEEMELGREQREHVRLIKRSGDHLLTLINDVLEFSRLDAGRIELETVAFDPAALVRDASDLFVALAMMKGLKLSTAIEGTIPPLAIGDPGRLRQVLLNLVGNAVKFTEQGWVRVSLRGEAATDDLAQTHVRLVFSVADSGIGMAPDTVASMFEEFTQMDGSISRRYGGSGLGLAICRRLVKLMGGRVEVDTALGQGSCFHFGVLVPIAADTQEAGRPLPAPVQIEARSLRVLLVEDNQINQLVARHMLERLGHSSVTANNGIEALALLKEQGFDLILMDAMMPEMDGLAATRHIRRQEGEAHQLIVGLTAGSRHEDLAACLEAGMDVVTTKPITIDRLRAVIAEGLAKTLPATIPPPPVAVTPGRWEELMEELGPEVAEQIGLAFIEDSAERLATLREAAAGGDVLTLIRVAHAVAGMARNVGAETLGDRAKALELSADRISREEIVVALDGMANGREEAVTRISTSLRTASAA